MIKATNFRISRGARKFFGISHLQLEFDPSPSPFHLMSPSPQPPPTRHLIHPRPPNLDPHPPPLHPISVWAKFQKSIGVYLMNPPPQMHVCAGLVVQRGEEWGEEGRSVFGVAREEKEWMQKALPSPKEERMGSRLSRKAQQAPLALHLPHTCIWSSRSCTPTVSGIPGSLFSKWHPPSSHLHLRLSMFPTGPRSSHASHAMRIIFAAERSEAGIQVLSDFVL